MHALRSALYCGEVVHARNSPVRHKFSYRVFALSLDVDEIDRVVAALPLMARNRVNVLSFYDRDFGSPDDRPVGEKVRSVLADVGLAEAGYRVTLLSYPRLWGYVFNPLSVYFCRDSGGRLRATVYEVTNTFHERHAYILESSESQTCRKVLYVSPFTHTPATYSFHTVEPADRVVVGVTLREGDAPVLRTHFAGTRGPITTSSLGRAVASHPLMTLKVVGAIHYEAARLWGKGVPVVERHASPAYTYRLVTGAGSHVA